MRKERLSTRMGERRQTIDKGASKLGTSKQLLDLRMPIPRPDGTRPDTNKAGGSEKSRKPLPSAPSSCSSGNPR